MASIYAPKFNKLLKVFLKFMHGTPSHENTQLNYFSQPTSLTIAR